MRMKESPIKESYNKNKQALTQAIDIDGLVPLIKEFLSTPEHQAILIGHAPDCDCDESENLNNELFVFIQEKITEQMKTLTDAQIREMWLHDLTAGLCQRSLLLARRDTESPLERELRRIITGK